jgi:hypothetical protein
MKTPESSVPELERLSDTELLAAYRSEQEKIFQNMVSRDANIEGIGDAYHAGGPPLEREKVQRKHHQQARDKQGILADQFASVRLRELRAIIDRKGLKAETLEERQKKGELQREWDRRNDRHPDEQLESDRHILKKKKLDLL